MTGVASTHKRRERKTEREGESEREREREETQRGREWKESERAPASNAHACTRETGEEEVDSNE